MIIIISIVFHDIKMIHITQQYNTQHTLHMNHVLTKQIDYSFFTLS